MRASEGLRLDHVVLVVEDLRAAEADFVALGFTIAAGGELARGAARNTLIAFADDTYLELFQLARPLRAVARFALRAGVLGGFARLSPSSARFLGHAARGEGLADLALLSCDLDADLRAIRARGARYARAENQRRRQSTGELITWRMAVPRRLALPFLIEPGIQSPLRAPGGSIRQHPNGVSGIAELIVPTHDLEGLAPEVRALLGEPAVTSRELQCVLGTTRLTWVRLSCAGSLRLRTVRALETRSWSTVELHGVRIELTRAE